MVAENSGYIDRDILKQALFLSTTEWDSYLDLLIAAAVNVVNDYTGHDFSATPGQELRYFDSRESTMLVIEDAFGVSSVKLDLDGNGVFETVLVEGVGFDLYPLNSEPKSAVKLRPNGRISKFFRSLRSVEVTSFWGWPTIPDVVKQATLLTASRWFKRRDAEYNDTSGGTADVLDSDVAGMLAPLVPRSISSAAMRTNAHA
jgi:hypothetical protein